MTLGGSDAENVRKRLRFRDWTDAEIDEVCRLHHPGYLLFRLNFGLIAGLTERELKYYLRLPYAANENDDH